MTQYEPADSLTVDGDAVTVDTRCDSAGVSVVGSVVSVGGYVSRIVVEGELNQSDLDALEAEFGVAWTEQRD